MRALPLILSLLLASFPAVQVYGKTMADAHCSTHSHASKLAPDAARDPLHAQHHAPEASADQHHAANAADAKADAKAESAHCQCGCLCNVACAGGVALSASVGFSAAAPSHEPWQAVADVGHPVTVHEFFLRPPRSLLS